MLPNIGAPELIIILVIALLILGPGKLPEVGASLGKSIREFRKASTDLQDSMKVDVDTSPLPATTPLRWSREPGTVFSRARRRRSLRLSCSQRAAETWPR